MKWPHYYDNSLIFKVTKERASIRTTWDPSCSSSTSSHMDRTNCVLRRPFSPIHRGLVESAVAIMSPAVGWLMKETLASEMRRQEGNTLRVNTIIDFIQMKSRLLCSESHVRRLLKCDFYCFFFPVAVVGEQFSLTHALCQIKAQILGVLPTYKDVLLL